MMRDDSPAAPLMRSGAALGALAVLDAVLWSVQCAGAWPRGWALVLDGLIFGSFLVIPLLLGLRTWREGAVALGQRLARRGDSEHAQAAVRIALGSMALAHMTVLHRTDPNPAFAEAVYVAGIGVALSWLLLLDVVRRPQRLRWRRVAANALDLVNLSMFLHLGGPDTAIWYPVYLWVTFGNGLRYDVRSLTISCVMSVAGFGAVIATTPYWSGQPILSAGLLIALIVLPAYIASLIRSVMAAKAQAEAANEAKSRFLAMMSHEVRTPLNSVMGFSSMLARTELGPPQREMLEMVRLSADNLLSLINDILDLAKIESGRPLEEVQDFDLWETVRTATRLLHPQAREKGLMVSVRIDARTPRHVHGMAAALRQVVVNLVGNAVKFTEAGRIDVAVSPVLAAGQTGGDLRASVQIVIEDQGIGIPPDMLDRIFEPFTQGDESITRQYQGSGLGLAIVRSLVEGMGGRVWVESARGVGSRFSLSVPLAERGVAEAEPVAALPAPIRIIGDDGAAAARLQAMLASAGTVSWRDGDPHDAGTGETILAVAHGVADSGLPETLGICSGRDWKPDQGWVATAELVHPYRPDDVQRAALGMVAAATQGEARPAPAPALPALTILVADDNETNRLMLGRMLGQEGHEVLFARDGEEALDAVESSPVDAVVMDINMPRMSGLEATRMLRFMRSGDRHLPVVALTADATPATARRCREAGMDDLITKPVDRIRLLASLARLCEPDPERRPLPVVAAPPAHEDDAADALPVLDPGMAATLVDEPEFLDRLYGAFAEDSQRAITDMQRSLAQGDAALLRDAAHSLRSAASNLGGLRLVAAAGPLKTWGNAELAQNGSAAVHRIEAERTRLLEALAALGPAPVP